MVYYRNLFFLLVFAIASCSSQKRSLIDEFPGQTLPVFIQAESQVNQNDNPLYVVIYQLKTTLPFLNLNFETLSKPAYQELSTSYVNSTEYYVIPGEKKSIKILLHPDTSYIGIFANYKKMNQVKWREIISLNSLKNEKRLYIHFMQNGISVGDTKNIDMKK